VIGVACVLYYSLATILVMHGGMMPSCLTDKCCKQDHLHSPIFLRRLVTRVLCSCGTVPCSVPRLQDGMYFLTAERTELG